MINVSNAREYRLKKHGFNRVNNDIENRNDHDIRSENDNDNDTRSNIDNHIRNKNVNENINSIGHSGNSDIDMNVEVNVDTTAIGFAILCSLLATGQMTDRQFNDAVSKLEELTREKMSNFYGNDRNDTSGVRLYNPKKR